MREQNIKEVLSTNIKFHPEKPRMVKEELLGVKVVLLDGKIVDDWDGNWGTSEFALLLVELEGGEQKTSLCGGKAVVNQVRKLLRWGKLPGRIHCFLNVRTSPNGEYYLLDWEEKEAEKSMVDDIPFNEREELAEEPVVAEEAAQ